MKRFQSTFYQSWHKMSTNFLTKLKKSLIYLVEVLEKSMNRLILTDVVF